MSLVGRAGQWLSFCFAVFFATPVWAFSEDLCWQADGTGVTSCTPLPAECEPVGSSSAACLTRATAVFAAVRNFAHARSSVHVDATYLMAQAIGFPAEDAYWIAAYDEAVDLGSYEPVDLQGNPIGGGALATAVLDGLVRTNLGDGGVFFHFISPRAGPLGQPPVVDGLHPDLDDAQAEGFLVHLRAWAMAGSGTGRPACTDGLTVSTGSNLALGPSCFLRESGLPADIDGVISIFGPTAAAFATRSGSQVIVSDASPNGPQYAESFDAVVGGGASRAADARLGIYLHALSDRISHHVCTDRTTLVGPSGLARTFEVDLSNPDCTQGVHALRHVWEVGVDQQLLAAEHRTLEAALSLAYTELVAFAQARGVLRPGAEESVTRERWVADLRASVELFDGAARLRSLARLACGSGLQAFPGSDDCLYFSGFE